MNLIKKKRLAAKTLKVGKNRISFSPSNMSEIKEAITKQDIKDLHSEGIISIKPVKGRKKIKKRKTKRGPGKIKKTINKRKQIYVKITRKLRLYVKQLKKLGIIDQKLFTELRNKISMRDFRSKAHLKDYLEASEKISLKPSEILRKAPEIKKEVKVTKKIKKTKTKKSGKIKKEGKAKKEIKTKKETKLKTSKKTKTKGK